GEVQPGANGAQLFCGGKYMTLARYPNEGWLRIAEVPQEGELKFPGDFRDTAPTMIGGKIAGKHYGRFTYDGDRPARWKAPADLWVHGYWVWDYADQYHHVQKLDLAKKEVWPEPPYHFYGYHQNARYYFLNVLEELDSPKEWYLDRQAGVLYFWPPAGQEHAEVVFPTLTQPLFELTGVAHVELRGLTMEGGRAGAVRIAGGDHVLIAGCTFRNFGDTVIGVKGGTEHTVRSCDLSELGAGGIALEGGDRKTLTPGNHAVENCEIHDIGRVQAPYRPAVRLDGVGQRVSHCYIHDCPHGGLGFEGNDHTIEYCEFTRIGYDSGDTGTVYTAYDWSYRGHTIRYNYFHGIHSPPNVHVGSMTLYFDLPAGGVHVYGNVFYDNQRAFFTNSGRDCLIENNIFVKCDPSVYFNSWRDMMLFEKGGAWRIWERLQEIGYDKPPYSARYPELLRLFKDGDVRIPTGNVVRCNVSTGGQFLALMPLVNFNDVRVEKNLISDRLLFTGSPTGDGKAGRYAQGDATLTPVWEKTGNVMIASDPGFVDAEHQDFRLKPDSPAWKLGFKPIPFEQIGLQVDSFRKSLPPSAPIISPGSQRFLGELTVRLLLPARSPRATIRYTLDGSSPTTKSPAYGAPLKLTKTATVTAAAFGLSSVPSALATATFTGTSLSEGVYLSDLPAEDVLAHPDLKLDHNYSGGPLKFGGKEYPKGLMMCPEEGAQGGIGHATWDLNGGLRQVRKLEATIGIEDEMQSTGIGSVVFIVEVFRAGKWARVFESPVLKWGDFREIAVDITGAEQLRLSTTDGGDNIYGDHAVWAGARVR
ncbi:MAG: NPCBM/NEW2 domain-containing protein, partial [Armatimonadota bacterium]